MAAPEKELLALWRAMDAAGRERLLDYARYLRSRHPAPEPMAQTPQVAPAPPGETVVAAIKRLRAGYPMLDRARLLDETAALVAQHTLQGRDRAEVIAELEAVFARHFQRWREERERS